MAFLPLVCLRFVLLLLLLEHSSWLVAGFCLRPLFLEQQSSLRLGNDGDSPLSLLRLSAKKIKKKKSVGSGKKKVNNNLKGFGKAAAKWQGCEQLRTWLVDRGAGVLAVNVGAVSSGLRGVIAANDIAVGDVIFSVPRDTCIWSEARSDASPMAQDLYPTPLERDALPPAVRVALHILFMQRNDDLSLEWGPALEVLPVPLDFARDGGPMELWSNQEVAEVECGQLVSEVHARKASLRSMYEIVLPRWTDAAANIDAFALYGTEPPTFLEFQHAVVVVTSRAYGEAGEENRVLLVPGVDLCNHGDPPVNARHALAPWGDFVVLAVKQIQKGEEIFMSYGPLPNRLLLAQFGFMLSGQYLISDTALVRIDGLFESDESSKSSAAFTTLVESEAKAEALWASGSAPSLLESLRVVSTSPEFRRANRDSTSKRISRWQSAKCARAIADALSDGDGSAQFRSLVERDLAAYSTTVEEDEARLVADAQPPVSPRMRLALSSRLHSKRLLLNEIAALNSESAVKAEL